MSSSRERFEAWYLQHMKQASGLDCSDREIAGLRDDQGYYGEQRHYLNGCWSAWQARDNEVDRLVEALRRVCEVGDEHWEAVRQARKLLREYTPKEKRDE